MHPSHENTKVLFPFAIPNKVQDNAVFWIYKTEDAMLDFLEVLKQQKRDKSYPSIYWPLTYTFMEAK